jgi:hypothetical protein
MTGMDDVIVELSQEFSAIIQVCLAAAGAREEGPRGCGLGRGLGGPRRWWQHGQQLGSTVRRGHGPAGSPGAAATRPGQGSPHAASLSGPPHPDWCRVWPVGCAACAWLHAGGPPRPSDPGSWSLLCASLKSGCHRQLGVGQVVWTRTERKECKALYPLLLESHSRAPARSTER